MTGMDFIQSDPKSHDAALQALWLAARGEWGQAHEVAQTQDDRASAWVHAYLHRVEGDIANAAYWYRRAHRPAQTGDLRDEWETIVMELLQQEAESRALAKQAGR